MDVAASTLDRWESDLGDLLGLDALDAGRNVPRKRNRARILTIGAVAMAGLISVSLATQEWRWVPDEDGGRAVLRTAPLGTAGVGLPDAPYLAPARSDVEQPVNRASGVLSSQSRVLPTPARSPGLPAAQTIASETPARVTARPERSPAKERLTATEAAFSETPPATASATRSAGPIDVGAARSDRPGTSGQLVVPLSLLLPPTPGNMRPGRPVAGSTLTPSTNQSGKRAGKSIVAGKTEGLDAIRSLRRQ